MEVSPNKENVIKDAKDIGAPPNKLVGANEYSTEITMVEIKGHVIQFMEGNGNGVDTDHGQERKNESKTTADSAQPKDKSALYRRVYKRAVDLSNS